MLGCKMRYWSVYIAAVKSEEGLANIALPKFTGRLRTPYYVYLVA
jgi:hypothetical protein